MALHMRLTVNNQQIGYLQAQRRPALLPAGRPTGNDVCAYDWRINISGTTHSNLDDTPVRHRYGDGAWALVARIIDAAGRGPEATPEPEER